MGVGEALQDAPALGGKAQQDAATIRQIFEAVEQPLLHGAVHQLDDGVVAEAEAIGGVRNGAGDVLRGARDLKKKLILLRLEANCEGGFFAEAEKAPELKPEVSQGGEGRR